MSQGFNPKIYSFVLTPEFTDSTLCWDLKKFKAALPSFAVLLDHTLGVIWHIFNNDGAEITNLNRSDIGWALRFLEAIDVSNIKDTSDLDKLKDMMRKILINLYAMEDELGFMNSTQQRIDAIPDPLSSSAIEEFYNSVEVNRDLKKQSKNPVILSTNCCTEEEILKKLQELNPQIQSLNDIAKMVINQTPAKAAATQQAVEEPQQGTLESTNAFIAANLTTNN